MLFENSFFAILFGSSILLCSACGDREHKHQSKPLEEKQVKEQLIGSNKFQVKKERDEIDQYIKHKGWQMFTSGTGLRYMMIKPGNGSMPQSGQKVKLNFNVRLLDGTLCYSSDSTGAYKFVVDQDNVESGLHEAVKYMHVGEKAVIILPSHLAYGLIGDEKRIPPRSSVLY